MSVEEKQEEKWEGHKNKEQHIYLDYFINIK